MALVSKNGLLRTLTPFIQPKRFRGKINIQKPRAPHFERAKYLQFTKPFFISPYKGKSMQELCKYKTEEKSKKEQDNPFQQIIAREVYDLFKKSKLVAFYHMNPITADQHYRAYVMFHKQKMFMKNFGKRTMELALKDTPYEVILKYYVSRNLTVFSTESNVKKLLQITRKFPQIILLSGIYEGKYVSKDELVYYSNIPNIQTAQSELVQTLNSMGGQIVSHLNSHQTSLVSQLQERIKQLEEDK